MEEKERKELNDKTQTLRQEISELKKRLAELNGNKEKWFEKKESLKKDISELIKKIKTVKTVKDTANKEINNFRKERDSYNNQVKSLIREFKEFDKERKEKLISYGLDRDPSFIKGDITKLERKLETEALDFDKEKKLMKQIKTLKKKYESVKDVVGIINKCDAISKRIKEAKEKAELFHSKLKTYITEGKGDYSEFIKLSKEIDKVKKEQEDAFATFIKFKQEFLERSKALKEKIAELNKVQKLLTEDKAREAAEKLKAENQQLEEKAAQVEEKLKSKKKLTTEDLLVFQREEAKK